MRQIYKISLLILLLSAAIPVITCCKSTNGDEGWNEDTSTFNLPLAGISYHLPTPSQTWAIADARNLPKDISFCGIDNDKNICIMIIALNKVKYGEYEIANIPETSIQKFIDDLSFQPDMTIVSRNHTTERTKITGRNAYKFRSFLSMKDSVNAVDSLKITYAGYIFDTPIGIHAIIATCQDKDSDSIFKYIDGIKLRP